MPFINFRGYACLATALSLAGCGSLPWRAQEPAAPPPEAQAAPASEEPSPPPAAVATPRLKPDPAAAAEMTAEAAAAEAGAESENAAAAPAPAGFPPSSLIGASRETVRGRLGAPDAIRVDAPAVTWLYESSDCALSVSFYSTVDGVEYKALQYRVSAREAALRRETPFNELDCVRSILSKNTP